MASINVPRACILWCANILLHVSLSHFSCLPAACDPLRLISRLKARCDTNDDANADASHIRRYTKTVTTQSFIFPAGDVTKGSYTLSFHYAKFFAGKKSAFGRTACLSSLQSTCRVPKEVHHPLVMSQRVPLLCKGAQPLK